jgi:Uma2 family endonuclease
MSAAPRFPSELGYAGLRMTADEYLALGETSERYELLDGVVFMSPSPRPKHGRMLSGIVGQLEAYSLSVRPLAIYSEVDLVLNQSVVYRPDVQVFSAERIQGDPDRLTIPPELIVELLSESTRALDLMTKKSDYERFGVLEYWVFDPADASVRQFVRAEARAPFEKAPKSEDMVRSIAVPGFALSLAPLKAIAG